MSFILDALKKSEMERQRQALPGLMEASVPRKPRGFPAWAIALAALLAVNLIVLAVVLTRGGTHGTPPAAPPPAAAAQTASTGPTIIAVPQVPAAPQVGAAPQMGAAPQVGVAPAATAQAPSASHFSPMDAPPVYAPEIPVDNHAAAPAYPPPVASSAHPVRPHIAEAPMEKEEPLATIGDSNFDPPLPEMHLDIHVYAAKPADRFVYINSRKYAEGATLAEGPVLERIRRDGAVLDYRGSRFLLPRQ